MQRETITVQTPDGPKEIITEWRYDRQGRITHLTQNGKTTEYRYDESGRQTAVINDGKTTEYRYNDKGQLVTTIYADDTPNNSQDNPRTVTLYDRGGRQRATLDRDGRITYYEYDAAGRLTATLPADDSPNQIQQLLTSVTFLDGYAPSSSNIGDIDWTKILYPDVAPAYLNNRPRSSTEYTLDGRIKAEIDLQGQRTEYKYDAIGRQTEIRTDADNSVTYTYDAAGNRRSEIYHAEGTTWSNTYDALGRLSASTDQNGQTTRYEYNAAGQLSAVIDPLNGRTEYTYDDKGNLTSIKDALSQTTQYEYDSKGRPTVTILSNGKRSLTNYDDTNNSVTVTDFNGDSIKYVYNATGELQRKELLSEGRTITYSTDSSNRTETITDSRGTTTYQYDANGRLLSRTDPEGPYTTDGTSIEYGYDTAGNLTSVSTPNRTIGYAYNADGTLESVTTPQGTTSYSYDSQTGNLARVTFPNSTVETRTYDDLGRLDVLKTAKIDPNTGAEVEVISSFDYDSDGAGNRLEMKEENGRRVEYEYDELNRVSQEKIIDLVNGNRTIDYSYDAAGNLKEKRDSVAGVTGYSYNSLNQLVSSTVGGVTTIYAYDDNGSLISRTTGSTSITYDWENDGENRLLGVTIDDGTQTTAIQYEYNEKGVRTGKKVNGVETHYLIDELQPYAQVVEEYDALGNPVASYTYGLDLISQQRGGVSSFYHVDGLGSTRALSDGSGNVTDTYTYDAYGNLISSTGSTLNPYLFAGEWRDGETGLDYLRARYYDAALGRFVSRDAYDGSLNDPMSLHKYQYAHANPVVNTDPSGYVTLGEQLTAFSVNTILATTSFVAGYGIGVGISGGGVGGALDIYDRYLAGFADGISAGRSTQFRAQQYGSTAIRNHRGAFFNLGRIMGVIGTLGLGWGAPNALANVGWAGRVAQLHEVLSTAVGSYQSTRKILEGKSTIWDWLIYLPLIQAIGSVFWKLLVFSRLLRTPIPSINNQGNLDIVDVEDLELQAQQLARMFDDRALQSRTVAIARIVNKNDPTQVRIVVASSQPGQLTPQRPLIQGSPGYDYVPRRIISCKWDDRINV